MILTPLVAMPHRSLNAMGSSAGNRKRRATHASAAAPAAGMTISDHQLAPHTVDGNAAASKASTSALPAAVRKTQDVARQHRRASSQSLTLDLDGLDLGLHQLTDNLESSNVTKRTDVKLKAPPVTNQRIEEDSFAVHLRECEDAHDIASVDAVLQRQPMVSGAPRQMNEFLSKPVITDGNEQVLGGFASLGFVKSPRPAMAMLGSETDVTISSSSGGLTSPPISPTLDGVNNSAWNTLQLQKSDPTATLDILSIDEMGLHSINVGSQDDWRGVRLAKIEDSMPLSPSTASASKSTPVAAEWTVARSLKRQRKWIIAPSTGDAARTVVVSDHIVKGAESSTTSGGGGEQIGDNPLFNIRFLQAGNDAPDCSIVLATPSSQRARIVEQKRTQPSNTTMLSSIGLDEEQMRSAVQSSGEAPEDTWPALRARTLTSAAQPALPSRVRERRLTHSKSTSTIVASDVVQIESRRPSLGKSISHEGLSADSSPRPTDKGPVTTAVTGQSPLLGDDKSYKSGRSSSSGRYTGNLTASSLTDEATYTLPSESTSPFGEYAIGIGGPQAPFVAPNFSPKAITRTLDDPSPRSSVQQDTREPSSMAASPAYGQPVLSQIDPARLATLQASGGTSPLNMSSSSKANSVAGTATHRNGPGRREKRLSEWLRRKVKPAISTSSTPTNATWSPPLPPAWESATSPSTPPPPPLSPPLFPLSSSTALSGAMDSMALGQKGLPIAPSSSSQEGPSLIAQRRRSNSDDVYASTTEAERAQLRHAALSGAIEAAKKRAAAHSPSNNVQTSTPHHPDVLAGAAAVPSKSVSAMSIPRLSEASTISPSHGLHRTGSGSDQLFVAQAIGASSPDQLGLEDVPADAMTMLLTLPLSNNADATFASRYLRVSFVPFHDGGSEDNFPITASGYVGPYGDEWNADGNTPPAMHSHHTWLKRLARPFHAQPVGAATANEHVAAADEEQQSMAAAAAAAARVAPPSTTTSDEKCQSFRIIARVLANPNSSSDLVTAVQQQQRKISTALAGAAAQEPATIVGSYAVASQINASLPQPFSFPVILGVYDNQGHLDLIPEGWQAIGLALGPAPAFVGASSASATPNAVGPPPISHPLRGVADVIIAGCAACMNL